MGPTGKVEKSKCKESEGIGDGTCYFVDSTHSNTWRALRIISESENLQYVEYDPTWQLKQRIPWEKGCNTTNSTTLRRTLTKCTTFTTSRVHPSALSCMLQSPNTSIVKVTTKHHQLAGML